VDATYELAHDRWSNYFDQLSTELFNVEVSIEIIGASGPSQVEASGLALQTLAYDPRGDVFEVAGARGAAYVPSVVRHLVDHPARIAVDSPVVMPPTTIAVDGGDGVRTVVRIERPADFWRLSGWSTSGQRITGATSSSSGSTL
jgi:hypothetical protein